METTADVSILLIGLSYVAISATLWYLVRRSSGRIPFRWLFIAFGVFIVACGGTHFVDRTRELEEALAREQTLRAEAQAASRAKDEFLAALNIAKRIEGVKVLVVDLESSCRYLAKPVEPSELISAVASLATRSV